MNYAEVFLTINPGFFNRAGIRSIPPEWTSTELVLDLRKDLPAGPPFVCPEGITFGEYHGELAPLHQAVAQVDENWVQYFNEEDRFYCAFDGDKIIAFCCLSEMGEYKGLRVGGPGCVGTIPAYRKQGIGLEMVRLATKQLQKDGYALSWIHYTHLDSWYMKLGYEPVLRWNRDGFLPNE